MANETEAQRWNGLAGTRWIANRERHLSIRARVTPHLFRATAITAGERVLDVGCGCGEATVAAARAAGPAGSARGLDLSAPMLVVARQLAAEAGVGNTAFTHGDAQVYPLEPAGYDVVISNFGVMFFEDPAAAFGNLRAALRPGGRLAFLCWQPEERNEMFAVPIRALTVHTGQPVPGQDNPFTDPGWVARLLSGAGFAGVRVEPVREPARLGSDPTDVTDYVLGTARIRELMAPLDAALAERVRATVRESFAAHERPDGIWVDALTWLVTARA